MSLAPTRWHVIAESDFPWEREALAWLREHLPNRDPWHVWCNFEFIDDAGKVNEVDALVLSPAGLFLVEIKSRPGELDGDTHTWTWRTEGRYYTVDNPLLLADRKAKRLATILRRQTAVAKAKVAVPYLEPLVFLSATQIQCKLRGRARSGVFLRGRPGHLEDYGLVDVLQRGLRIPGQAPTDWQQVKAISKALAEAGIRPSNKHRRVGEYKLGKLIAEGDGYQDWLGQHVSIESVQRRIRIHTLASAASPEARAALVRSAGREFEVLEGIEHSGILRCREYKDTELGPALVFDHDPGALRLDHLMREHGTTLDVGRRLQLVRDIAEILKFAHGKRLYHRGLGPQSILIRGWGTGQLAVQVMNWQTASRNADAGSTAHRTTGTRHVEDYVEDPGRVYLAPETAYAEPGQGAALDVYALGSLTYLIFGGQAPADSSLALQTKLRQGQGLRLADIFDGCPPKLAELVQFSTNPDLGARYDSVDDFLKELDVVEDELTAPDPETTADPSRATVGERLTFSGSNLLLGRYGTQDVGYLDPALLIGDTQGTTILLGGKSWSIRHVDFRRRTVALEPAPSGGKARWQGAPRSTSFVMARAIRDVVRNGPADVFALSRRARDKLEELRDALPTAITPPAIEPLSATRFRVWTWAGTRWNRTLANQFKAQGATTFDELSVQFLTSPAGLELTRPIPPQSLRPDEIAQDAASIKFAELLPQPLLARLLIERLFTAPADAADEG